MPALQLAQLDATGRTVTAIVFGLLAVAAALALLTAWYWRVTDPRRSQSAIDPRPPRRPPDGAAPVVDDPDTGGATVAIGSHTSSAAPKPDDTTVLDRRAILHDGDVGSVAEPPEPSGQRRVDRPPVATPAPVTPEEPDPIPSTAPGDTTDETVIDLREEREVAPVDVDPARGDEDGLSFEEWLALVEEDS